MLQVKTVVQTQNATILEHAQTENLTITITMLIKMLTLDRKWSNVVREERDITRQACCMSHC